MLSWLEAISDDLADRADLCSYKLHPPHLSELFGIKSGSVSPQRVRWHGLASDNARHRWRCVVAIEIPPDVCKCLG